MIGIPGGFCGSVKLLDLILNVDKMLELVKPDGPAEMVTPRMISCFLDGLGSPRLLQYCSSANKRSIPNSGVSWTPLRLVISLLVGIAKSISRSGEKDSPIYTPQFPRTYTSTFVAVSAIFTRLISTFLAILGDCRFTDKIRCPSRANRKISVMATCSLIFLSRYFADSSRLSHFRKLFNFDKGVPHYLSPLFFNWHQPMRCRLLERP